MACARIDVLRERSLGCARNATGKLFICSFIWIIGEKVELGLVNWLVFKCLTLRGLLKGNFSDSELESIRVDNGSERDRVIPLAASVAFTK
ncbi:hypothetical protein R1flu_000609 [Riccia fluitans]|uniref:Uncharacterized protein n=1 Tax=Riccia fluitans TaxID=41844 RepID=A0ABD1Y521_9MARC